jgi:hypothetical protein
MRDYGLGRDTRPMTTTDMLKKWKGKIILFVIFLIVHFRFSVLVLLVL